eukprot:gene9880-20555_t
MQQKLESPRQRANTLFNDAFNTAGTPQLPHLVRIERARKAISLYIEARNIASAMADQDEWLSSTKNVGWASFKLASMPQFQERFEKRDVIAMFEQSMVYLVEAHGYGLQSNIKHASWTEGVRQNSFQCAREFSQFLVNQDNEWKVRLGQLIKMITAIKQVEHDKGALLCSLLYCIAVEEAKKALVYSDEAMNWRQSLDILAEADQVVSFSKIFIQKTKKMKTFMESDGIESTIDELVDDFRLYGVRSRSKQYIATALDLRNSLLFEKEDFDMDIAYLVIDQLHMALIELRSTPDTVCLESEAAVLSHLGHFYEKALRMDTRANKFYMECHQLAQTVYETAGNNFYQCEWFIIAKDGLERIRQKRLAFDEAEIAKQREPIMATLKPQLDAIQAAMETQGKDASSKTKLCLLIKYVQSNHPSKLGEVDLPVTLDVTTELSVLRKITLKFVNSYHTDKPQNKSNGIEWYFLCEEIVKDANKFYGDIK